jgi:hypothetical protein
MKSVIRFHWDILWWDVIEVVIAHPKEIPTDRRNVVGLRKVGHGTILSKTNTLRGEDIEFRLSETISRDMRERRDL